MARKPPELTQSVIKRVGCKGVDCIRAFSFMKRPRIKLSKNGVSWEYGARCPNCPKVMTFSEAMMKNIRICIKDITIVQTTNTYDDMFDKT